MTPTNLPEEESMDSRLRAALRHAPDAELTPPAALSAAILRQARAASRPPARPWWTPLVAACRAAWQALSHPALTTGLAGVMVATVVGLMWWDRVPQDEGLDRPPPSVVRAPAKPASPPEPEAASGPSGASVASVAPSAPLSEVKAAPAPAAPTAALKLTRPRAEPSSAAATANANATAAEELNKTVNASPAVTLNTTKAESAFPAEAPRSSSSRADLAKAPEPGGQARGEGAHPVRATAPAVANATAPAAATAPAPAPAPAPDSNPPSAAIGAAGPARARSQPLDSAVSAPSSEASAASSGEAQSLTAKRFVDAAPAVRALHAAMAREPGRWTWRDAGQTPQLATPEFLRWWLDLDQAVRQPWRLADSPRAEPGTTLVLARDAQAVATLLLQASGVRWVSQVPGEGDWQALWSAEQGRALMDRLSDLKR